MFIKLKLETRMLRRTPKAGYLKCYDIFKR